MASVQQSRISPDACGLHDGNPTFAGSEITTIIFSPGTLEHFVAHPGRTQLVVAIITRHVTRGAVWNPVSRMKPRNSRV